MLFVYTGWYRCATMHRCGHRGPTSRFSAASMCLLGSRVVCMEPSPAQLPFDHFSVEAPKRRRSGKIVWDFLDVFWVWVCVLQLEGKRTKAIPNPSKTKGSIILGTSCLLPSLVQPRATLKDTKTPTTMVGHLFSGVKFLNQFGLSSCVCLSNCHGACCLHVFVQSPSQELTHVAGVCCLLGLFRIRRRSVPLKAKASGPRDGELCSVGSIFAPAYSVSFLSASLSQILLKNSGILASTRGEKRSTAPSAA